MLTLATSGCADERVGEFKASEPVAVPTASAPASPEATRGETGEAVPPAIPRKIIYNAQIDLVVESVSTVEQELARLVKASGGYISQTDVSSQSNVERRGTWRVRIPVDRFDAFVTVVGKLGELQRSHVDSQDVTMEYYDLEARIGNKQVEEKRLLKHLDESTGKLKDIIDVEHEISRVRGEVEQMQGRIRFLANQSALSTVTITAIELKGYTPPESPTFATQIRRTFLRSVQAMTDFGKAVVLFVVAIAAWLPLVLVVMLFFGWILRRQRTGRSRASQNRDRHIEDSERDPIL